MAMQLKAVVNLRKRGEAWSFDRELTMNPDLADRLASLPRGEITLVSPSGEEEAELQAWLDGSQAYISVADWAVFSTMR